jgi:hypothetical protein
MTDLISRARHFATEAHSRINHVRKYTNQPYQVHLKAVAQRVASVTDDQEVIAAAWLHDTVEDTTATFHDIEAEFGARVMQLVSELTDVSRPGDGNRAKRKKMDRDHLAAASPEGKTVKLADLIDNCNDICKHDERFGRVFVKEMAELLTVLQGGNPSLYKKAVEVNTKWLRQFNLQGTELDETELWVPKVTAQIVHQHKISRRFVQLFTAQDIAEPLVSFDSGYSNEKLAELTTSAGVLVIGVREGGLVKGYLRAQTEPKGVQCDTEIKPFHPAQVVTGDTRLAEVIGILTKYEFCFVELLGQVSGVICREDIQKPEARMWLFGIITMIEMFLLERLKQRPDCDALIETLSPSRLAKARELYEERMRRGHHCSLADCLQLSDKAQLLTHAQQDLSEFGFETKGEAKKMIKELESLRNHLAHAQDIVAHDWPQIARMAHRMDMVLSGS